MFRQALVLGAALFSSPVFAQNCSQLQTQAMQQSALIAPTWEMNVRGSKGFRTYFHQAPDEQCKVRDLFLIPDDYVLARWGIEIKNQVWLYVVYMRRNGTEVSGWVKSEDLKFLGKLGGY